MNAGQIKRPMLYCMCLMGVIFSTSLSASEEVETTGEKNTQRVIDPCLYVKADSLPSNSLNSSSLNSSDEEIEPSAIPIPIDDCDGGGGGGGPYRAPGIPTKIDYSIFTLKDNKIVWGASNGYGYSVQYKLEEQVNNGAWSQIYSGYGTSKYIDNRATGRYKYRIKGCNSKGCSSYRYGKLMRVKTPTTKNYSNLYPGLEAARAKDPNFVTTNKRFYDVNKEADAQRQTGTSFEHNLGKGFGLTEGQYAPEEVCLEPDHLYVNASNENRQTLNYHQIKTREELYRKLNLDISASLSLSIGKFGTQADAKYQLFRESEMLQEYSMVLVQWEKKVERLDLQSSQPRKLKDYWINGYLNPHDSNWNPEIDFRNQCGDKYLSAVVTGARLYILLEINNENFSSQSMQTKTWEAKAKLASVLSASSSGSISDQTKEYFNNNDIRLRIVNEGGSDKTSTVLTLDIEGVKDYYDDFVSSVTPNGYVALEKEFSEYPLPQQYNGLQYYQVFYDYSDKYEELTRWIALDNQVHDRCDGLLKVGNSWSVYCDNAYKNLGWQALNCANGEDWVHCKSPYAADYLNDSNQVTTLSFPAKFKGEIPSVYADDSPTYSESFLDFKVDKPGWLGSGNWGGDKVEACIPNQCLVDHGYQYHPTTGSRPSGTVAIPGSMIYVDKFTAKDGNASHYLEPQPDGRQCLVSDVRIKSWGWPGRKDAYYEGHHSFHGLCPKTTSFILP